MQKYFDEIKSNTFDYNAFEIIGELCDDEEKVVKRDFLNIPIVNNFMIFLSIYVPLHTMSISVFLPLVGVFFMLINVLSMLPFILWHFLNVYSTFF